MGVIVIGLGGIGSALVEPLARYMNYNGGPKELALVDGDSYERRNLERQRAGSDDLARNKARVHSEWLKKHFKGLSVTWHEEFVTADNVASLADEPGNFGVLDRPVALQEKRPPHACRIEGIEYHRSYCRIRTVVERQGEHAAIGGTLPEAALECPFGDERWHKAERSH